MKFCLVFLTLAVSSKVETFPRASKNNALLKAFVNISEALSQWNHLVSVVVVDDFEENCYSAVFSTTSDIPHIVSTIENKWKGFCLKSSAIVSMDSVASLKEFNKGTTLPLDFSNSQQVVIHFRDGTFDQIDVKMQGASRIDTPIIQYEYFVVEEEKSIRLLTFVWYTPITYGKHLVEVNKFDKSSGRWQHGNFRVDKFSNFHGYQITFLFKIHWPEFDVIEVDYEKMEVKKCRGFTCAIVKDLSSALNYTCHMILHDRSKKFWRGIPYEVLIETVSLYEQTVVDSRQRFVTTRPIIYLEHFITVPPGEKFNGYEKMLLPFDEQTWMWIGITFGTAFITIFGLRFVQPGIANFVTGKDISTPALNVLRAFFGISQIISPQRNFARYLLMMFILFSLVMRTAYQGKMFEFLQKEIRKPTVTTIDEMIDQNFTFYMLPNFKEVFRDLDLVKRGNVIDEEAKFHATYKRAYISGSKTAFIYKKDMYQPVIQGRMNRTDPPKVLAKRFMLDARSIFFDRYHWLFDSFDRKLQQYIEADLVNYNIRKWNEDSDPKKYHVYKEPFAVLTLGELEAGFVVCMVPLVFSIFVFAIEWMLTLKDLIVFLFIFKKYFETKKLEQNQHNKLMKVRFSEWQVAIEGEKEKVFPFSMRSKIKVLN